MKRRGKGEGSLFQLSDGRWAAEIDIGFEGSKRKRKRVTAKTQAEVLSKVQVLKDQVKQGLEPVSTRLTVEKFLTDWLIHVKSTRSYYYNDKFTREPPKGR